MNLPGIIASLVVILQAAVGCRAARPCFRGGRITYIRLEPGSSQYQSETIAPVIEETGTPHQKPLADGDAVCRWGLRILTAGSDKGASRWTTVLEGISAVRAAEFATALPANESHDLVLSWHLVSPAQGTPVEKPEPVPVAQGMLQVLPLSPSSQVGVTLAKSAAEAQKHGVAALKATVMKDGYCSREITHFQGNCHMITPQSLSLDDQLLEIDKFNGAAVQLASFSSIDQIRSFINANKNKFGQPLNFTSPVRIGLFYGNATGSALFLNTSGALCQLEVMKNPQEDSLGAIKGRCGTLRVNETGSPVLEFLNCRDPMPALISFPERPPKNVCSNYTSVISDWLKSLQQQMQAQTPWYLAPEVMVAYGILGLVIVAFLVHCCRMRKVCAL